MGTKRALVPAVNDVISHAQSGTMLDAFSGMCSIGEAIGAKRQVWSNDAQIFASEVAKALFLSRDLPLSPLSCGDIHFDYFQRQQHRLSISFSKSLASEAKLLGATSYNEFQRLSRLLQKHLSAELSKCRIRSPHLFTKIYSGTYFGVQQAIDADAIVAAIGAGRAEQNVSRDEARWETIALGRSLLKVANSTGHFAQYLKPKPDNYGRFLALRRRSVWEVWLSSLAGFAPIGSKTWRTQNKVFNQDSLHLLPRLAQNNFDLSVVYADPPYTDDQYSRFYHLLETLCLYDYPTVSGGGLYRRKRFHTRFSLKSEAPAALQQFIQSCARMGADLVLSYPTNGLVSKAGLNIRSMLRKSFKRVELCYSLPHQHSTFGASKGSARSSATELIYLARSA